MKFPKVLRVGNLLAGATWAGLGIVVCAFNPEVPKAVRSFIDKFVQDTSALPAKPPPPRPSDKEINEVLSGSLALVEAQHTYYVHITHNDHFAPTIGELGSRDDKGGTVMVLQVWNASDAVPKPQPVHGYLFRSLPVSIAPGKKDGFVIVAYPADHPAGPLKWPLYLSIITDAKGGMAGMSSRDTWEVEDPAAGAEIRSLLKRGKVTLAELSQFSPGSAPKTFRVENFRKEVR